MTSLEIRIAKPSDSGWIVDRHANLYRVEAGFDATFAPVVRRAVDSSFASGQGRGWIAEAGGAPIGCIFCVLEEPGWARLRLFLLEPEWRGKGLGHRLLRTCMEYAQASGAEAMRLSTHASHRAACALYARSGWVQVAARPVRNYGCDLEELDWEFQF
ncbi:GNAT family N-acetyltransferase [Aestuariibius sp. 2305UL40-4]|uniref:GNAT family N-acetyltransferase n=1 Tax=Aestuariibius violaceus TaxID=3234132 RepID=UPI00345ED8DF